MYGYPPQRTPPTDALAPQRSLPHRLGAIVAPSRTGVGKSTRRQHDHRDQQGRRPLAKVGSLNLHYLEWGEIGAPPVVMVHGLTGNAHAFDNLAPHFATRYHVISMDVHGRDDSDWVADGNYSNDAYVADLEGLRQTLGIERMSLVGTSMGGRISLTYAGTYPKRVERTVLNDIGPEVDPLGGSRIANTTRDAVVTFETIDEVMAWHRENRVGFSAMSDAQQRAAAGYAVKTLPGGGCTWKMDPAVRSDSRRTDPEVSWKLAWQISGPVPAGAGRRKRPAVSRDSPAHGGGDAGLPNGGSARGRPRTHSDGARGLRPGHGIHLLGLNRCDLVRYARTKECQCNVLRGVPGTLAGAPQLPLWI